MSQRVAGVPPVVATGEPEGLNMAESIQRILKHRALDSQHPKTSGQIIDWLETVAHSVNQNPTPFSWAGKRSARRQRTRCRSPFRALG